jgi:hypothetical protein
LDVPGASPNDGIGLIQYDCGSQNNQLFDFVSMGNGKYQIKSHSSGKCLDVYGASDADGAKVIQYTCGTATNLNQLFTLEADSSLKSVHSKKCLGLKDASLSNGGQLQQWTCNGKKEQQWVYK